MTDLPLLSSIGLSSIVFFYLGMLFVRRTPREYLLDAMRIRQVDGAVCERNQDGVCFPAARKFAVRQGAAKGRKDYLFFHEIAHQALADRGLVDPEAAEESEAAADVIAWLLCRRTGVGDALDVSFSVSPAPGEVLLSLQEIATVFQVADHLLSVLVKGGLNPPQSNKWSQQNV